MTNEEKSIEIAKEYSRPYGFGLNSDSSIECYQSAMQAMQWKDEQHKAEKQKWTERAAAWLRMTMDFFNNGEFNTDKFVNDFKQEMNNQL